ncbi:MAG: hypothetical protein R3Y36_04065 [Spirochaetales bacterium]
MAKRRFQNVVMWVSYASIVVLVCMIIGTGSCALSANDFTVISGDYTAPVLENFLLTGEQNAILRFSCDVTFPLLEYYEISEYSTSIINAENPGEYDGAVFINSVDVISAGDSNSHEYTLIFPDKVSCDKSYILSGTVKDSTGSSLTFSVGFTGFNARVPRMIFSEVSTEYSNPRVEFVEFYVLEDGNLAGMILHSAGDGEDCDYVFPSVEVKKGEYVVLHMRTKEEDVIDETGDDLTLSGGKNASSSGRDLWIDSEDTRLSKNDVLLLRESLNGRLADAVAYVDGVKTAWPKDAMESFVIEAVEANLWQGGTDVSQAINIEKITTTRTLSRQNIAEIARLFDAGQTNFDNSKDNWIIVATSNLSPGSENSTTAYIP